MSIIWFTLQVAVIATVVAAAIGLPIGLAIGLGRFRGRRVLQVLANASLGLPPVLVGLFLFLFSCRKARSARCTSSDTKRAVFIAQTILALPYIVALSAAAIQGLPPAVLAQARALGAGRRQLCTLALREARIGVIAAVIAALGSALSEVGAIVIVGGNVYGYDQTLASGALYRRRRRPVRRGRGSRDRADRADPDPDVRSRPAPAARRRDPTALPVRDVTDAPVSNRLLLRCEHLSVRRGERDVVRDVSLQLRAGELVAMLGPNGVGKSTLLDALVGALPPARGSVERNGRIAIALQSADLARRTVLANVILALSWWGVPRGERTARAHEALHAIGVEHLAQRSASALSG